MEFLLRAGGAPRSLGVLPGSFHPLTRAHVALAGAALEQVDEVLFVMPRRFPHKEYEEVTLEQRMEIVTAALAGQPRCSAGISEGGLFIEIARECRQAYPGLSELWFLCGRDAAERITGWDYGTEPGIEQQLEEFGLLVADRAGSYAPPAHLSHRVKGLAVPGDWDHVSASEVRRRIKQGLCWRHLTPEGCAGLVERYYS
jgi:nicotinate-nucleotide adenylyltransferase